MIKERSPFTPGRPVPTEFFVGRITEIEKIMRSAKQVSLGKQENIFLCGERGIGKTSLASFIRYRAEKELAMVGVHTILGGVTTLEEMVKRIIDKLLKENIQNPIFAKLKSVFSNYIKEVGLFGVSVQFDVSDKELKNITDNFLTILRTIYDKIKDEKKGILIILDDLNGLVREEKFANFIKSFIDEIATSQSPIPLMFVLCGLPERRQELIDTQPSIARIFPVIEILPLDKSETIDFYKNIFEKEGIKIEPAILNILYQYSGGLPMLLHEVGDAVYWADNDNIISHDDATIGISFATKNVGEKYLDRQVYKAIKSEKYRTILDKMATSEIGMTFRKEGIETKLNDSEKKVFNNFLQKMKKLGVITSGEKLGEYVFANELFRLYIRFEPILRREKKHLLL
ncbi:MAG: ATP-binding protein [Elusimicrobiota bacterium]